MTDVYSHPTYLAFINRIRENPEDDQLRLACSDWLEENGKEMHASLVRGMCTGGLFAADDDGLPEPEGPWYLTCYGGHPEAHVGPDYTDGDYAKLIDDEECVAADYIRLAMLGTKKRMANAPFGLPNKTRVCIVNGFIEEVRLSAADWIQHGDEIVKRNPVRKVTLTGVWPVYIDAGPYRVSWPGIEFTFEFHGVYSRDEMIERTIDQLGEMTNADLSRDLRRYVAGRR